MQRAVERVRGFYDVEASSYGRAHATLCSLLESFRRADFAPVDVPVVEHLDLYLRKNGAQVVPKIYGFVDQGKREVALRPEFTASIIRAMAPRVGQHGGAVRVAYSGPVFRYEKPQRATGRQFTQAGVELLGDGGPLADAEVVGLACRSARDLGLTSMRLVIGHLGPLRALLGYLQVDGYAEQYLLEHLEYFNRGAAQQEAVRRRLGLLSSDTGATPDGDESLSQSLAGAVRDLSPAEARQLVAAILEQMGLDVTGSTRSPEEIIDRVLVKARRRAAQRAGSWRESLERALAFVEGLGSLAGHPSEVLARTEELLERYGVPLTALDELRQVLDALQAQDLDGVQVELAPGMARGIAYYSGLIFELYADDAGTPASALQICGGGRYDGLAQALTGRSLPALGFAFGIERVLHALPRHLPPLPGAPRLALIVGEVAWRHTAQRLASRLRERTLACAVYEIDRAPARAVEQARQAGYTAAILLPDGGGSATLQVLQPEMLDEAARAAIAAALAALPDGEEAPRATTARGAEIVSAIGESV